MLPSGLVGDRRWMVVDDTGTMVSARTVPRLFLVTARTPDLDGIGPDLLLSADGHGEVAVTAPTGTPVQYGIHARTGFGVAAGAEADRWLATVLERNDVHLVWCPDPTLRPLNPAHSRPGDATAFADGYPVLLTTTASLDQLNHWLGEVATERNEEARPLPMTRFRPNIVVDGEEPFAEDGWQVVRIGQVRFRVAKPCDRCVMTTIDPVSLARGKEPIRTLARHRRVDGKTLFGMNLIPDHAGTLRVGDPVEVIA